MRTLFLSAMLAASCSLLSAEFTYQQTTQMTGGAMFEMMKMAGPFARQAREPVVATMIVKGNRMATVRKDQVSITDLDKETITDIDFAKKQYSVVTFAQMKEAMEKMIAQGQARAQKQQKGAGTADMNFKVSAKTTGQTKTINGISSRQIVLEMVAESSDPSATQGAGGMNITMDNWLGNVPGYDEVQTFQRKMGEKMAYAAGSSMMQMPGMRPEMMKGFQEASKEMAKVDGAPVQSIMRMTGAGGVPDSGAAQQQQQQQQQQSAQQQAPPQNAGDAAVGAALGRFGIGGFGRNRNKGNEQKQQPPPSAQQADAPPASATTATTPGASTLMEMTTELSSFSPTADGSKFEVPSGFKQVDNPILRLAR